MELEDTYNIHKKINCIFPHFKLKILCKHNIHNYRVFPEYKIKRVVYQDSFTGKCDYKWIDERKNILKCYCCGKEEELEV